MSRKPTPPVKPKQAAASSTAEQAQAAIVHLEKGRHRDAIAGFKALLKTEPRPEWLAGLASAYEGRAKGLAAQDMLQEAIGVWRSRAELCGTPLWGGPYATWLIHEGRLADVLDHLSALRTTADAAPDAKPSDELATLEAQLTPALLQANEATLARLPADSLLRLHHARAMAALAAYASKDTPALEEALAGIPFRSPYRDLRTLLKAMVLRETDPAAARQALERLAQDGPFEPLAAPVRAVLLTGTERLRQLSKLTASQQAVALDLLGCPSALAPLLRALTQADAKLSPAALFDLVQRNSRDLPTPLATLAWQQLAPWATRRGCASPRLFGSPTPAAQECATALAVEITGEWDHAEEHWLDAAKLLGNNGETHDPLRAALVLRHLALSPAHLSGDGILDKEGQVLLAGSLKLDPDDSQAHVRLVQYWRRNDDLKSARAQLEVALARFPDEVALLSEALEIALAAGAFKKAATTARRVLALDPLNSKVRAQVGNAHLSHAAKQIAAKKLEAAQKEVKEAANWLDASADQSRIHLLQAWSEPLASAERLRLAQLVGASWGNGLAAGWRLLREAKAAFPALHMGRLTGLLKEVGIDTERALTATDLLELAQVLEQNAPGVHKGLDVLAPWRKALVAMAATPAFDAQATIRICEAFSRHHEHELLEVFANAARKRWPEQPIFVYHAVAARFGQVRFIESARDYTDLEKAGEQARQSKDLRLASRIDTLFDVADEDDEVFDPGFGPFDIPDSANPFGMPSMLAGVSKMNPAVLRGMIEEAIKFDGIKPFLKLARDSLGAALYRQVENECAGDKKAFQNRIIDLLLAQMTENLGRASPFVPPKNIKPNMPAKEQGNLFNE